MQFSSASRSVVTAVTAVVLGGTLIGCGETAAGDGVATKSRQQLQQEAEILVDKAQVYTGDPWETRFREQFWSGQHIHDSWNRCHLGENVSRTQQRGPGC